MGVRNILLILALFTSAELRGGEQQPSVLIIGDFVYQEPSRTIAQELQGAAKVVFSAATSSGSACSSTYVLQSLDTILGKNSWDLIYINVGLADLTYRAPGMQSFRVMPKSVGGIRTTAPQQYEENVQAIIKRLKSTGSKVIWGSTTPPAQDKMSLFDIDSEIAYNAIAEKIMKANAVPMIDMHAYVNEGLKAGKAPPGAPGRIPPSGRVHIHTPIVAVIVKELKIRIPEQKPAAEKGN